MLTPMFAAATDVAVNAAAAAPAGITGNLHVAIAALGSAIAVGIIGMKASEAVGRNPGAAGKILTQAIISSALAEGIVFFAIFLV
jgi:F-type H+-transporting ATPase subunit c